MEDHCNVFPLGTINIHLFLDKTMLLHLVAKTQSSTNIYEMSENNRKGKLHNPFTLPQMLLPNVMHLKLISHTGQFA